MVGVQTADTIVSVAAFILAYMIATTIAGSFRAFVAYTWGDDTAASEGFLSLNPFAHIDIVGLMCLIMLGLGWGPQMPIDKTKVQGEWRVLKLFSIFAADIFAYLVIAVMGIVSLMYFFGQSIFNIMVPMMMRHDLLTYRIIAQAYPTSSSLGIVVAFIVISVMYVSAMLSTITIIMNGFRWIMNYYLERAESVSGYADIIMIIAPLVLLVFLSDPLRMSIIYIMCVVGSVLGAFVCPV